MQCDSCSHTIPTRKSICPQCGERGQTKTGVDVTDNRGATERPLVTDGGKEPPDDESGSDPLSDQDADSDASDDEDGQYLEPDEIVGDDIDEDSDQSTETVDADGAGSQDEPSATAQPTGGQPTDQSGQNAGQPAHSGGQPPQGQNAGQPGHSGGQQSQGQNAGQPGHSGGQQPRQGSQPAGSHPGGTAQQRGGREDETLLDRVTAYPLKLGTALGAIAFLLPYILVTVGTYWAYEKSPPGLESDIGSELNEFDVGAEIFMSVAEFGRGGRIVEIFRQAADVSRPENVDPSNYPTVEDELGPVLEMAAGNPEVPLLLLYVMAPYIVFISARYLARHYAPRDTARDRALAGASIVPGTFVLILLIGIIFPVVNLGSRLIIVGGVIPGTIGAFGGLSVWGFDDKSAIVSSLVGWTSMGLGIALSMVILPLPGLNLPDNASLSLSFLDRAVLGLGMYLNSLQFNMGAYSGGRIIFMLVALITFGAGFFRAWQVRDSVTDRMDGARVGASIWLGFVTTIALLLWVFPMSTALVNVALDVGNPVAIGLELRPDAIEGTDSVGFGSVPSINTIESVGDVRSFFNAIVIGGMIFPMTFGGLGGYAAVWQRDR